MYQTIIQEYPVIMFSEYESRHVSKNKTSEKSGSQCNNKVHVSIFEFQFMKQLHGSYLGHVAVIHRISVYSINILLPPSHAFLHIFNSYSSSLY